MTYSSTVRLAAPWVPVLAKRQLNVCRRAGTGRPEPASRWVSMDPAPTISTSTLGNAGLAPGGKGQALMAPKKQPNAARNVSSAPSIHPLPKSE